MIIKHTQLALQAAGVAEVNTADNRSPTSRTGLQVNQNARIRELGKKYPENSITRKLLDYCMLYPPQMRSVVPTNKKCWQVGKKSKHCKSPGSLAIPRDSMSLEHGMKISGLTSERGYGVARCVSSLDAESTLAWFMLKVVRTCWNTSSTNSTIH